MNFGRSYKPTTFAERGAVVAFTTPALTGCRVRRGYKQRLEVLVPNLAEGRGTYVIPATGLQDVLTLTLHDRLLLTELQDQLKVTPAAIRKVELRIASMGIAGLAPMKAADRANGDEAKSRLLTNYLLITQVVALDGRTAQDTLAAIDTVEGEAEIRSSLRRVAARVDCAPLQLDDRIAELSQFAAEIGLKDAPGTLGLRVEVEDLRRFRDEMRAWMADAAPEHAAVARYCSLVADETYQSCKLALQRFDTKLRSMEDLLRNFREERVALARTIDGLSWLLDGWNFISQWWSSVRESPRYDQITALTGIFRVLPPVPVRHLDERAEEQQAADISRSKWVRLYESWRTGDVDGDLIARIEAVKAKAA